MDNKQNHSRFKPEIIHQLDFYPLWGITSRHFQLILPAYLPAGKPPLSTQWLVEIGNGDRLSCEVSTPEGWKNTDPTVALLHGLGGCHTSRYMIRMARKLTQRGLKVIRINLRGCGSGKGLSKLPYCAGNSQDILHVVQSLKKNAPESEITLIGFSLGGNIVLKLAGESGDASVKRVIAVCPSMDLSQTVGMIQQKSNRLYHHYYLKNVLEQSKPWVNQAYHTIYEYDDKVTGPTWGFSGADEYYQQCSSKFFLDKIRCETLLLFAKDDPFVSMTCLQDLSIPQQVWIGATEHGSHMGFLGRTDQYWDPFWMDQLLLSWVRSSLAPASGRAF